MKMILFYSYLSNNFIPVSGLMHKRAREFR